MAWGGNAVVAEPSTSELLAEIRQFMPALKQERLQRILDTKPADWSACSFIDEKGARCLTGHLEDWRVVKRRGKPSITQNLSPLNEEAPRVRLIIAFSSLCARLGGAPLAAKAIRELVLAELARREKHASGD
jgi:hypothetical protein